MPVIPQTVNNRPHTHLRINSIRKIVLITFALIVLLLIADYYTYPRFAPIGGQSYNCGENGLWLRYKWYFGEYTDAQTIRLAQNLVKHQIRYAYFHVRSVEAVSYTHLTLPTKRIV